MKKKSDYFVILIGVLSLLTIIQTGFSFVDYSRFIVSMVGLLAVVLFYKKSVYSSKLIYAWIVLQAPYLVYGSSEVVNGIPYANKTFIWDASQLLKFHLGFTLNTTEIKVNVVPLLFLGLYRFIKSGELVGQIVTITKGLPRENKLGNIFPLTGQVLQPHKYEDKSIWLSIKLDTPFTFNGESIGIVLIKPKDDKLFDSGKSKLSFMRLVNDSNSIEGSSPKKFPFIDFVKVKIDKGAASN